MAPVRNTVLNKSLYKPDKNDENLDFSHFSTQILQILNGQLLKLLCCLYKGTYKTS